VWVSSPTENSITAFRASDGKIQGIFPVGLNPHGVTFDGANIWVACVYDEGVVGGRARTGRFINRFRVEDQAVDVISDGISLWVPIYGDNTVDKITRTAP